ncbi:hypothetical protein WMY93_033222 [Mugilogobius chulae]|uniref:PX domain-containing protein n=1 Tax=Mugilogobius chulae TaxID=88201 RepID=A0AAW0MP82_9GOBI
MPEVKSNSVLQFVLNNLRPHDTDLEATSFFTMKIEESLKCVFVKFNFMTHNLAQGKKTGGANSEEGAPSTSTNIQDAVIQRTFSDGKQLIYELRISIDDGFTIKNMTFGQFELIHKQIKKIFIDSTLPQFPSWFQLSFTPARKMSMLNTYLKQLFEGPCRGNEFVCKLFMDGPEEVQQTLDEEILQQLKPDTYVITRLRRTHGCDQEETKMIEYDNVPANAVYGMVLEATVKSRKKLCRSHKHQTGKAFTEPESSWFPLGNCEV